MTRYTQQHFFILTAVLVTAVFFLAACGPADTAVEGEAEANTSGESAETTTSNPRATDVTNADAPSIPSSIAAFPAAPEAADVVGGIEMGFTEDGRPYMGSPDAPIVLEEFSDFQCPFCQRFFQQTMPSIKENQIANGEVRLIFYDFPLNSIHPQAAGAANAARCAGEQGITYYWDMHDLLFEKMPEWSTVSGSDVFIPYGEEAGLEMAQYTACVESDKYADEIEADLTYGASRGVRSTPSFFINEQPLIGAQPLATFEQAFATISGGGELASVKAQDNELPPEFAAPTPAAIALDGDTTAFAMGDPNAAVTIVEYTDYQCPFCNRHAQETLPRLIENMIDTGRVYYVIKDFPLDQLHAEAREAALSARCAGEQDTYLEMHDAIFASQSVWSDAGDEAATAHFAGLAEDMNLDMAAYEECVSTSEYPDSIQASLEEGSVLGVTGTPAFFINGYLVSGAQPYDVFEYVIELGERDEIDDVIEEQARQAYQAYLEQQNQPQRPPTPSAPVDIPTDEAYSIGDPNAPVTLIEYTDYQCPFCGRHFQQTFPLIQEQYIDTGQVRYVFKDFPLTRIHPQAVAAANAARCAGEQDAY
ncbi:MAG TPA: hypothetical protein ENK32_07715, partial [Anaerolineae bacterium]|nr:hypothetical protein [Anaerolineae bacterium]